MTERFRLPLLALTLLLLGVSVLGIKQLTVENRFIDYFQEDTEIHQGMLLIDQKLGGTTPLDIIIDAPVQPDNAEAAAADPFDDPFADPFTDAFTDSAAADPFADPFADEPSDSTI